MRKRIIIAAMLLAVVTPEHVFSAVPGFLNLQGRLTGPDGNPITTATQVDFHLYQGGSADKPDDGVVVYKERAVINPGLSGIYEHLVGRGTPLEGHTLTPGDFDTDQPVFLQMSIGGEVLLPRIRYLTNAYAFVAEQANLAKVAETVKSGSVTSDSVLAQSLTSEHITPDSITSESIKNGTLTSDDVQNSSLKREKLDLASFQADGTGLVPQGAIFLFLNSCPAGYSEVTALRNRFPMGADTDSRSALVPDSPNETLGSTTHEHTISHTHQTGIQGGFSGEEVIRTGSNWVSFSRPKVIEGYDAAGGGDNIGMRGYDHLHSVGEPSASASGTTETLPPSLTVIFCRKN